MKEKNLWILIGLVVTCIGFWCLRLSAVSESEKIQLEKFGVSTLARIEKIGCKVMVAGTEDDANLPQPSELTTQVELALRKSGIKVVESKTALHDLVVTVLVVRVPLSDPIAGKSYFLYQVLLTTEFLQTVVLAREPNIGTFASTWPLMSNEGRKMMLLTSVSDVKKEIRDALEAQVNNFINDFLAANPKERPEEESKKPIHFTPIEENEKKPKDE